MKPQTIMELIRAERRQRTGSVEEPATETAAGSAEMQTEVSVRAAKDQLSALLDRAARGERIVITSDGQPKAMIVRYKPVVRGKPWESRKAFRDTMPMGPDSTPMIRAERDSGY